MIKKLSKYGNSKAIVIDKPILELLGIDENTELEISTDGESLLIRPVSKTTKRIRKISKNKKLQKIFEENIKEYNSVLKKLAKN